jgi:hypothetical protein
VDRHLVGTSLNGAAPWIDAVEQFITDYEALLSRRQGWRRWLIRPEGSLSFSACAPHARFAAAHRVVEAPVAQNRQAHVRLSRAVAAFAQLPHPYCARRAPRAERLADHSDLFGCPRLLRPESHAVSAVRICWLRTLANRQHGCTSRLTPTSRNRTERPGRGPERRGLPRDTTASRPCRWRLSKTLARIAFSEAWGTPPEPRRHRG